MQSGSLKRDVIILTSNQIVYKVVRSYLTISGEHTHPHGTIYEYGIFSSGNVSWNIGIVQVPDGNANSAVAVERAIDYTGSTLLFSIDLAYGSNRVRSGDIIIANKVYGYEHGKSGETLQPMPEVGKSSHALIQRAQNIISYENWYKRIQEIPGIDLPTARIAPIAAGEKEITAESSLWSFFENHYNDTEALDMTSSGFLEAAHANLYVQSLIIRGIIHPGDQLKLSAAAANHASAFAFEVLSKLGRDFLYHHNTPPTSALEMLAQLVPNKNSAEISAQQIQGWFQKGNECFQNGQYRDAISAYGEALRLENKNPVVQNKYGEALFRLERYKPAIKAFEKAIENDQHYSLAYRNKGDVFVRIGDYDGAFGCYVHALRCDRKNWAAYIGKGNILYHQKNFDEAIKTYRQLIKGASREERNYKAEAYRGLGNCFLEQGGYSEAIRAYEDALERNPGDALSYKGIGDAYNSLQDYRSAVKAYDISIARKPDTLSWNAKGWALFQLNEYEKALEAFEQAIRLDRKNLAPYRNKIYIFRLLEMHKEAHEICEKALRVAPTDASIYRIEGDLLKQLGDLEKAVEAYNSAILYKIKDPVIYKHKGNVLRQLSRFAEAISAYEEALIYIPEDPDVYRNKGIAFIGLKEYEEAMAAFDLAITYSNDIYSYRCKIGILGEICKSYTKAIQVCDEALRSFPDNEEIQRTRVAYLIQQKSERSLTDYDTEILSTINMSILDERLSQENSGRFLVAAQMEGSLLYDDYSYTLENTYPLPVVRREERKTFSV